MQLPSFSGTKWTTASIPLDSPPGMESEFFFGFTLHLLQLNPHAYHDRGSVPDTTFYAEFGSHGM